MRLMDLIDGLQVGPVTGDMNIEITGIAYDSRKVKPGYLFVCIEGFKTDGHNYIGPALENGAAAFLVQKAVKAPEGVTVIHIADTRYGLAYVSDRFCGHPSEQFKLVGVTGTKGKTTTTYMIKAILEELGEKVGLIGTIVNSIGSRTLPAERTTPEAYDLQALFAEMADQKADSVIMEVSSHALELHRVSCSKFDIGVFTNLSQDHLDFHETFEKYFQAKMKLFQMCRQGLVNLDNEYGQRVAESAGCRIYTYAIDREADFKASDIVKKPDSVEFMLVTPEGTPEPIRVNIPGKFSVYNALAAIGVCRLLGISFDAIRQGLERVSVPGRAEVAYAGKDFSIIIDYAHSPDSLENILTTVKGYAPGRVVCVFGCGGDRDRTKRPIMGEISGKIADFTIITSDNPRTEDPETIVSDIEAGMKRTNGEYIRIVDRREAIRYSMASAKPGDVVVLAGKGHETYQIFRDKTIHFDEREVVKEILQELGLES